MIKANNIHKYFDKLHVLKGVNLHIKKGEIVSIAGSGAGKTTLLQIMGTLDKPTSDKTTALTINGEDILKMNDKSPVQIPKPTAGIYFSVSSAFTGIYCFGKLFVFRLISQEKINKKPKKKPKNYWII